MVVKVRVENVRSGVSVQAIGRYNSRRKESHDDIQLAVNEVLHRAMMSFYDKNRKKKIGFGNKDWEPTGRKVHVDGKEFRSKYL